MLILHLDKKITFSLQYGKFLSIVRLELVLKSSESLPIVHLSLVLKSSESFPKYCKTKVKNALVEKSESSSNLK